MSLSYVGFTAVPADNTTYSGTSRSVTPPVGLVAGDLVVVMVLARTNARTFSVTNTGGQDWTAELVYSPGTLRIVASWWCRFNGTWDANPVFGMSGGSASMSAICYGFRSSNGTDAAWRRVGSAQGNVVTVAAGAVALPVPVAFPTVSVAMASWNASGTVTAHVNMGPEWVWPAGGTPNQWRNTQVLSTGYAILPTAPETLGTFMVTRSGAGAVSGVSRGLTFTDSFIDLANETSPLTRGPSVGALRVPLDYDGYIKVTLDGAGGQSRNGDEPVGVHWGAGAGGGARAVRYLRVHGGERYSYDIAEAPADGIMEHHDSRLRDADAVDVVVAEGGHPPGEDFLTPGMGGRASESLGDTVVSGQDGSAPVNPQLTGPEGGGPAGDGGTSAAGTLGGRGAYYDSGLEQTVYARYGYAPGSGSGGRDVLGWIEGYQEHQGHGQMVVEWGSDIRPPSPPTGPRYLRRGRRR